MDFREFVLEAVPEADEEFIEWAIEWLEYELDHVKTALEVNWYWVKYRREENVQSEPQTISG